MATNYLPNRSTSGSQPLSYTVKAGDTLTRISWAVYNNPNFWRQIADANGITDPRTLTVGQVLLIPRS